MILLNKSTWAYLQEMSEIKPSWATSNPKEVLFEPSGVYSFLTNIWVVLHIKMQNHSFTSRHACSVIFLTSKYAAVFVSVFTFCDCILVAKQADADMQLYFVQPDKQALSKFLSCINIFFSRPFFLLDFLFFFFYELRHLSFLQWN